MNSSDAVHRITRREFVGICSMSSTAVPLSVRAAGACAGHAVVNDEDRHFRRLRRCRGTQAAHLFEFASVHSDNG